MVRSPRELAAVLPICRSEAKAGVRRRLAVPGEAGWRTTATSRSRWRWTGSAHGVHLWERDCSVQRRHQKILEESPSPAMTPTGRRELAERAIRAVVAAGYENVGTLEFLVDDDGNAYFIEINCRIQVEHPVTEMLTGIDLVATQIRIAAGEPLGFTQADVPQRGHAIEFRINAEDPAARLPARAPAPSSASTPRAGPGVRFDSHAYAGYEVPPYYDSLLGKLIVWGPTREAAIARGRAALDELVVEGVVTNTAIHRALLASEPFLDGPVHHQPARPDRQRRVPRGRGADAVVTPRCTLHDRTLAARRHTPAEAPEPRDRRHPRPRRRRRRPEPAIVHTVARDRGPDPAPLAVPARRPDRRVRPRGEADRRHQGRDRHRVVLPGPLPGPAGDARRPPGRGAGPDDGHLRGQAAGLRGPDRAVRGDRRGPLQAGRRRRATSSGSRSRWRSSAAASARAAASPRVDGEVACEGLLSFVIPPAGVLR